MSRRHPPGSFVSACVLVLLALTLSDGRASGAAQDADQQTPTFRSGTDLVYVDAYPRRDGRIVEGLTAGDFDVREDGVRQQVEYLEFVRVADSPSLLDLEPLSPREAERLAADPSIRVFVIYLDMYHTTRAASVQSRAIISDLAQRVFGASDVVAVITQEDFVSDLTFDRRPLDLLDVPIAWGRFCERTPSANAARPEQCKVVLHTPLEHRLAECVGPDYDEFIVAYREDALFSSLENLMVQLGALRDARKNVIFLSDLWRIPLTAPVTVPRARRGPGQIPPIGPRPGPPSAARWLESDEDRLCIDLARRLNTLDYRQRFRDLLRRANATNVSFYPVDLGGLAVGLDIADASSPDAPRNTPFHETETAATLNDFRVLAAETDGRAVINTNDIGTGLDSVFDDLSAYYLIGYSPTNTALDGTYRRIDVDVAQGGVSLSARRGYFAALDARADADADEDRPDVPATVTTALDELARLRSDSRLFVRPTPSAAGLDVVVELTEAEAGTTSWSAGADVRIVVTRDGEEHQATGRIPEGARSVLLHLPLAMSGAAGPGSTVRAEVTNGAARLVSDAAIPPADTALAGVPVVYRRTGSARAAPQPVAEPVFHRREELSIEWRIAPDAATSGARLLDARGAARAELPLRELSRDASGVLVTTSLPTAALAPGDYVIELSAERGDISVQRVVAFRVTGG